MTNQTIFVDVACRDDPKTITLKCKVPTNAWELIQLLKPHLLEHKYQHRSVNKTIVLRDKRGTLLHPYKTIHKAYGQRGTHLTAELLDMDKGNQGRRFRGRPPDATGSKVRGTGDTGDVQEIKDEDSPRKDAVSPAKRKRRKSDENPECLSVSLPKHHSSASKYRGDHDQTLGIQTRRKSRTRLALKMDQMTGGCSSDNEDHQQQKCSECGDGERMPSVRLSLKRKHNQESGQSPSNVDLTLRQRACPSCLGGSQQEKPTPSKQRRKINNTTDSVGKRPSARTGVAVKKCASHESKQCMEQKTQVFKEDYLSSSLKSIHLEDDVEEQRKRSGNCAKKKERNVKLSEHAITSNIKANSSKSSLGKSNDTRSTQQGKTRTSPRKQLNSGAGYSSTPSDTSAPKEKIAQKNPAVSGYQQIETKEEEMLVTGCVDTKYKHSDSQSNDELLLSKDDTIESTTTDESVSSILNQNRHREACVELVDIGRICDSANKKDIYCSAETLSGSVNQIGHGESYVELVDIGRINDSTNKKGICDSAEKNAVESNTRRESWSGSQNHRETCVDGETCVELVDIGRICDSANKKELLVNKTLAYDKSAEGSRRKVADDSPKHKPKAGISIKYFLETNSETSQPSIALEDNSTKNNMLDLTEQDDSVDKPITNKSKYFGAADNHEVHEAESCDTSQLSTIVVDYQNRPSVKKVAEKSTVEVLGITQHPPKSFVDGAKSKDGAGPTLIDEDDTSLAGCDCVDSIFLLSPVRGADIEGEQSFVVDTDNDKDEDSPEVEVGDSQEVLNEIQSESDEGDPIILKIARYELRHSDLETLEEGEWLNDCVINAYFILLKEASPLKIFTHSSFFFFSLYKRGYEGVQRWTKNVDLFTQDLVFIPIHNKSHWTLVVVHVKESVIEYYNSSTLLDGYPRSMLHIRNYLLAEAEHRGKTSYCNVTWEMYIVTDIPRQQNMDDCGLFICQYAKKLSLKENVAFNSRTTSNLRQHMLRELLNSKIEKC